MLGTVLGAYGNTNHHRHFQHIATHGLPFGKLVKHLVTTTAEKITVHDLRDYATAAHCISDGRSDNRTLRNGRIEQTVVGQCFSQATVNGKCTTPVTVLFAISYQG